MKKLVLIFAFILTTFVVSAQSLLVVSEKISDTYFTYGPKVALNMSNLSIKDFFGVAAENPMKANFAIGGFINYRTGGWIGLQAEIVYSRQGTGIEVGSAKGAIHVDYINIPILAKFYLFDNFSLEAGPQVGFLVSKRFKDDARLLKPFTDFHTADIAIAMGAAYDFDSGLTLDLRYNLGLVNTFKSFDGHNLKSKNGVMQLSAAWNF